MCVESLRFFPLGVILQFFFLSLLLARARGIRDNTQNYTDSALRVCNGLNVVPVGCLTLMPPILGRERVK